MAQSFQVTAPCIGSLSSPLNQGSETVGIALALTPNWKHGKRAIWKYTPRGRAEKTVESWLPTTSWITTAPAVSPHCLPYASVLKGKWTYERFLISLKPFGSLLKKKLVTFQLFTPQQVHINIKQLFSPLRQNYIPKGKESFLGYNHSVNKLLKPVGKLMPNDNH